MEYKIKSKKYKKKIKMMQIMFDEIINMKINDKNNKIKQKLDELTFLKNDEEKQIILVIGLYGVGKSTLIKYLEKYITNLNKTIIIKELNYDDLTEENLTNNDEKINIIHIIPENTENYKSKIINKLYKDYKNNENTFINYLKDFNINTIENNIDLYKAFNKNKVLSDINFDFLDPIINYLYNKVLPSKEKFISENLNNLVINKLVINKFLI